MFVKRLLQFNLLASAILGLTFILVPRHTLALYGLLGDGRLYLIAQYFGSTHVAFSVLLWLALAADDSQFLRMIVISFFAGDLAGTIVLLIAQLNGLMNTSGWALVGLSALLALGYGYGTLKGLPE